MDCHRIHGLFQPTIQPTTYDAARVAVLAALDAKVSFAEKFRPSSARLLVHEAQGRKFRDD